MEAPGTAPGSATLISQAVYRHSRLPDNGNIGRQATRGNPAACRPGPGVGDAADPGTTGRDREPARRDPTDSAGPRSVSVKETATTWGGASKSDSGTCFYIYDPGNTAVKYGKVASASTCAGADAVTNATSTSGF